MGNVGLIRPDGSTSEIRPLHSEPLEPAPDPTENLAPLLLGQEDSNDHHQQGAEENYAGRVPSKLKSESISDKSTLGC